MASIREPLSFAGRTAFVTGAGGGMGRRIAEDLMALGADVAMYDVKPEPGDLKRGLGKALYVQGDLRDDKAVGRAMNAAFALGGRLDYLANVAGVLLFDRDGSAAEGKLEGWDLTMEINLKSLAYTVRHAVPYMRKGGGGAMVHVSSIQCMRGDPVPQDAYQASKAGVLALSRSLAIQLGKQGIRSNAILPGVVRTPMQARWDNDAATVTKIERLVPIGRIGTAEDISNLCLFLLSDLAGFITGTEIVIDGGMMAMPAFMAAQP